MEDGCIKSFTSVQSTVLISVGQTVLNTSHHLTGVLQHGSLCVSKVGQKFFTSDTCGRKHAPDQSLSDESRWSQRKAKPLMTN